MERQISRKQFLLGLTASGALVALAAGGVEAGDAPKDLIDQVKKERAEKEKAKIEGPKPCVDTNGDGVLDNLPCDIENQPIAPRPEPVTQSRAATAIQAVTPEVPARPTIVFTPTPGPRSASAVVTYARTDLELTDDEDPSGWVRVKYPYQSPNHKFEYTAPTEMVVVSDGRRRWIARVHKPWKYTNWLPDYAPTARRLGLIQSYAPWTGDPETSGAFATYDELHYRITGKVSNVREKAEFMSKQAMDTSPDNEVPSQGLCDAGALATAKEVEPQEYTGFGLYIPQEVAKSMLIGFYRHRVPVAPFIRIDPPLTREQIEFNINITRKLFRSGKGTPVYNVLLNGAPGFWGRTQYSESEDGAILEVTEFQHAYRPISADQIRWADSGEHPDNSIIPVDSRLVKVFEKYAYGMDSRIVRHASLKQPLPQSL